MDWNWIIGPAVGTVIGYFTNWIAVKMLFRPRREYRIFGHRVPFTPGAIPKGKPALAKAVANAVTGSLLTKEDLKARATSPELTEKLLESAMGVLNRDIDDLLTRFDPETVEHVKVRITDIVTDAVLNAVRRMPISQTIVERGGAAIREKVRGTMLQMFISDSLIASFAEPIAKGVNGYIDEQGPALVSAAVRSEMNKLTASSVAELGQRGGLDQERLRGMIMGVYTGIVDTALDRVLNSLDLGNVIENKINDMSCEMLEELVMSVMKNELSTIVNLGAIIGLILGVINALLNTVL